MTSYPGRWKNAKSVGLEAEAAASWKAVVESGSLTDAERRAYETGAGNNMAHTVNMARIDDVIETIRAPLAYGVTELDLHQMASGAPTPRSAPAINLAPVAELEALVGPHNRVRTDFAGAGYFLRDDTVVRVAPRGDVWIDFDGDVRTITLHAGFIFVARPAYAPGSLLVLPSIGGVIRVERGGAAAVEIRDDKARCQVVSGVCVITIEEDDFELGAGEGASFDGVAARSFDLEDQGEFARIEARLAGRARALGEVIESLRSFSDVPITCASTLAALPVAGEYDLLDTRQTLAAIARELSARLQESGEALHLAEDRR